MAVPDGALTAPGVPRIALGLAALGRPAYITLGRAADLPGRRDVDAMEARTHEVLDTAWAAGVRYGQGALRRDARQAVAWAERSALPWR